MADKDEGGGNVPRGNDWEVVSLTASAYAASPGAREVDVKSDEKQDTPDNAETSNALFMSRHFVFPPTEHENLPLEPDSPDIHDDKVSENVAEPALDVEQGDRSKGKDDEDLSLKGLDVPDEYTGMKFLDDKSEKERSIYDAATLDSFNSETVLADSIAYEEKTPITELAESFDGGLDSAADTSPDLTPAKGEHHRPNLPCEAWWKRTASSLYAHAKEANAFWSVFVAAAVMGLVVLGQRWQQERWQVLQLKLQTSISDEKTAKMFGPISRLKEVILGGQRRVSFIRGGAASEI